MIISIINHSKEKDEEVQRVIRAINRQLEQDFEPYWSFGASLRLEGKAGPTPNKQQLADMRGDAVLYLWDTIDVEDALGYHDTNNAGIPYGFVFPKLSEELGEKWSVTLSHEALELVGDAQANLLVQGPHPETPNKAVFHWFEMCDAVQSESYKVDGVDVSNFVLPLYFTEGEQQTGRNDFLGRADKQGRTLASFGVKPGGYIGFYDPQIKDHTTWPPEEDAPDRLRLKRQAKAGRGSLIRMGEQNAIRVKLARDKKIAVPARRVSVR